MKLWQKIVLVIIEALKSLGIIPRLVEVEDLSARAALGLGDGDILIALRPSGLSSREPLARLLNQAASPDSVEESRVYRAVSSLVEENTLVSD